MNEDTLIKSIKETIIQKITEYGNETLESIENNCYNVTKAYINGAVDELRMLYFHLETLEDIIDTTN